ncbi:hypothetical protein ACHAXR_006021 [Thalassiosira sp. AJA248-18]
MEGSIRDFVESHGANVNQQGGVYHRGVAFSCAKKIEVAAAYVSAADATGGRPNISQLQRDCKVSRDFVRKIEKELLGNDGMILHPSAIQANRPGPRGPGSRTLDDIDSAVILFLYLDEPSRSLADYVNTLGLLTGTVASKSTISRFFTDAFPHRGGMCRPNLVPFDKFRPANIQRAVEYVELIASIDPERIKFGDEKHLKGDEIFNRKVRRNPLTGEVPEMTVDPDFRNRYNLTGFCSINPRTTRQAVWCSLHECINDADNFSLELEYAIRGGFFRGGDVLVLDNAAVHTGKENTVLEDYLWSSYGIFLIFLPARAPEWNPMQQVWNCTMQRVKEIPLYVVRKVGKHATAHGAIAAAGSITHKEVRRFYVGSGIIKD